MYYHLIKFKLFKLVNVIKTPKISSLMSQVPLIGYFNIGKIIKWVNLKNDKYVNKIFTFRTEILNYILIMDRGAVNYWEKII